MTPLYYSTSKSKPAPKVSVDDFPAPFMSSTMRAPAPATAPTLRGPSYPSAPGMLPGYTPSASAPMLSAPGMARSASASAPMMPSYHGSAPISNYMKTATSTVAPPPSSAPNYAMLSAPTTPGQFAGYNANMQTARNNARNALSAPLPTPGPLPTGGSASITLPDGRTISREYSAPGMYNQSVQNSAPGMAPLSPELSAPTGKRDFSGYTPGDVTRIAGDRSNYAAAQNERADSLGDAMTYPGYHAEQRDREESRQVAMSRAKAETDAISAGAESTRAGTTATQKQNVDLQARHKTVSDQVTKLTAERDKLQQQLQGKGAGEKPIDPVAMGRESRIAGEGWMRVYNQFKAEPEFQAMTMKERIAMAKELAADTGGAGAGGAAPAAAASAEPIPADEVDVPDDRLAKFGLRRLNGRIVNQQGVPFAIRVGPNGNPHAVPVQ